MNKKRVIEIMLIVILGFIIISITNNVIKPNYFIKSIIRIIFFLVIPLIYLWKTKVLKKNEINLPSKKEILKSLLLGVMVFFVILSFYLIARHFYDFSVIKGYVRVTPKRYMFAVTYVAIINSLLEEIFFRQMAFIALTKYIKRELAYLFSSVIFAIYHISIIMGWFSPILFAFITIILIITGCIFDYLDEKSKNIYNSWIVHIFANFSIGTIGLMLFEIM